MFHWRDGWFFARVPEGTVHVVNEALKVDIYIPAAEWASIVASVSVDGETTESYYDALGFHLEGVRGVYPNRA